MHSDTTMTPGVVRIPLYRYDVIVAHALVDAADLPLLGDYRWRMLDGYAVRYQAAKPRIQYMHRILLDAKPGQLCDHKNRVRSDCRRENLRLASQAQNRQNLPSCKNSTSRFRGVHWDKAYGLWRASIRANGREIFLGRFLTEEDAGHAALNARKRLMPFAVD